MLAEQLGVPFVELNRQIEARRRLQPVARSIRSTARHAYRRYERRALEETIQRYPRAVIATPGGIVSEPATFNLLLAHCYTVWLQATPEEHMGRVLAQGDTRPMAGKRQRRGDGRPAPHPGQPRGVLLEGRRGLRHQRPDDARRRFAGLRGSFATRRDADRRPWANPGCIR